MDIIYTSAPRASYFGFKYSDTFSAFDPGLSVELIIFRVLMSDLCNELFLYMNRSYKDLISITIKILEGLFLTKL